VQIVSAASLENLPSGDSQPFQWTDLHGEGAPGLLAEQGGAWFYKRNWSGLGDGTVDFGPLQRVPVQPNLSMGTGQGRFIDLAGDGRSDLAVLDGPITGFYEHDEAEGWEPFRAFPARLNRIMQDPHIPFVALEGDGRADLLLTEDDAFVWYPSLGETGFGDGRRIPWASDEEQGPRLVFADPQQTVFLADMSGDGLTDLVRVRNGEVSYWPNVGGYG